MTTTRYETDLVAWANEQAQLVHTGQFELLDLEHMAEEIEDVDKSEQLNDSEWLEIVWGDAVYQASKDTGLNNFPETSPWSMENILTDGWMPIASN